MSSFLTRTISSLVAVGIIGGLYYFLDILGLKIIILFAVIVGSLEINQILFKGSKLGLNKTVFVVFSILIFGLSSWHPIYSGLIYTLFLICFCVFGIGLHKKFSDINHIANFFAKAALGFFYVGLLPSFTHNLLDMQNGLFWFLSMLCVVFAGDIGAYLVGMKFGRKKILPSISPKKTVEGSIGGLCLSLITGLSFSFLFPHVPMIAFAILSVAAGVVAQFGDFFESLLKRVADVKDSGNLMPGHGGVLDRVDGVLFASPVFLLGAILLEKVV